MEKVISELNLTHGPVLHYSLELKCWERNVAPGAGRPQQVINDQIGTYDIFVGIMWRKFGTPTGVAGSGTEEEFRRAYSAWEQNRDIVLMFYFCQKPFMPGSLEEIEQIRQVLIFRKELEGKALVWNYNDPECFADEIRKHLCLRLNKMVQEAKGLSQARATPQDDTIQIFKSTWQKMSPELQKAFSIAYNENRRTGDPGVKTEDLFAALLRIDPEDLRPIIEVIPKPALPEPIEGPVSEEPYIIQERPWLSGCVTESIHRLSKKLPEGRHLTTADVFADIAKHGTGSSVARLRANKIGPERIDNILQEKNIQVITT